MFTLYDDLTSFSKNIIVKCEHEFFSPFYKVWTWKIPSFCCNFTSFCSFLQCEYCEIGNVSMGFSKSLVFDSWFGKHHTHISSSQYSLIVRNMCNARLTETEINWRLLDILLIKPRLVLITLHNNDITGMKIKTTNSVHSAYLGIMHSGLCRQCSVGDFK